MRKATDGGFPTPVSFRVADGEVIFEGWTDGSRWNGWLNVEVTPATRSAIVEEAVAIARRYTDHDLSPEETDEATGGMDTIPTGPNGRVSFAGGFTTCEA